MAIDLDVVTRLDRSTTREAAREAQRYFEGAGRDASGGFADEFSKGLTSKAPEIQKAFDKVADASGAVIREQEKMNALQEKGTATKAQLVTQAERVARAYREEERALQSANRTMAEHDASLRNMEMSSRGAVSQIAALGQQLGGLSRVAGPVGIGVLAEMLGEVASVAASASQSLIALPAVVGSVATAMGTLKLATVGFGDAMTAIADPEKFAEALQNLSPSAQQAALSIRALMPEFEQLRFATQDSLFAGLDGQINRLTTQYLPAIQQTTTGVASAFNGMLGGVADQLMTPQTQGAIQGFLENTTRMFQEMAPAAAPLTSALAQLMSVGSNVLPAFGEAATNAANSFNRFITEANQSGDLSRWLNEGLDTLSQLVDVAWNFGEAFMSLGATGRDALPGIVDALNATADILPDIINLATQGSSTFETWAAIMTTLEPLVAGLGWAFEQLNTPIAGVNKSLGDLVSPLQVIRDLVDGVRWFFDPAGRDSAQNQANNKLREAQERARAGLPPTGAGAPGYQGGGGSFGMGGTAGRPGIGGAAIPVPTVPGSGGIGGSVRGDAVVGGWTGGLFSSTYDPVKEAQATTKAAAADAPPPQFDASQWQVDPTTQMSNLSAPSGTGPGGFVVDQNRVASATERLSEAKLRLLELEADTNVKQSTLVSAKNNVNQAERELIEAQQGTWKKANDTISGAMGDLNSIFAPFDEDFGLSGGLPGVVKNLTTLLGNFALAGAIKGSPDLQQGAAFLMSQGQGQAGSGGYSQMLGGYGSGGFGASAALGGGAYPGDQALLAGVPAGRYSQDASRNLFEGLSDCSSSIGDLVAVLDGKDPNTNPNLATGNAASMLPGLGFQRGMGGPGDFRVGYNSGHMQATLPGGTNWNYGSDAAAAQRGQGGSKGADDPAFTDHWYRPVASPSAMGPTALQPSVQPAQSSSGGWGGNPGLPNIIPGSAGQGFLGGQSNGPGVGGGAAGTQVGYGNAVPSSGGQGGVGVSGDLMGMAGGAADLVAPGSSIALKLANRAIQYGSQAAAIGVSGAIETFLPAGSPLASGSWFGKLVGGLAGAKPASPNTAGPKTPPKAQPGQQGGPTDQSVNITNNVTNQRATEDGTARDLENLQMASWSGPQR